MGKPTGFMEYPRQMPAKRPVAERIRDDAEIYLPMTAEAVCNQAARCMDCGVATCMSGCPLGNRIPDWNDLVYRGRWRDALEELHATNNFPEFTGRLCPAPCEEACVLSINDAPVTIEQIEKEIIEYGFARGWVQASAPSRRSGRRVAVIGSGPAGLACAQQLNRAGHRVTVFERQERIGGLLRYGIPDFKMKKFIIDRRLTLLQQEGIELRAGVVPDRRDVDAYDAAVLCTGATSPRDLPIPGRQLAGIHFAMDFLKRHNQSVAGTQSDGCEDPLLFARGKHVVVIGGGDTGSDCVGVCNRQGAESIVNFQYTPRPPEGRPFHQPWPYWPMRLRTSTSHEEGCHRRWGLLTKRFAGHDGRVQALVTVEVDVETRPNGVRRMVERPGSERKWPADLVLLAIGFAGPESGPLTDAYGIELAPRGNLKTDERFMTAVPGIFAAGDARRGQSLIVWTISEGREVARAVDTYLTGESELPGKGCCDLPLI